MTEKKKILLYDGDYLRYSIGFANEIHVLYRDGVEIFRDSSSIECTKFLESVGLQDSDVTRKKEAAPLAHCLASVKRAIASAVRITEAERVIVYLSGSTNFRTKIAKQKEYKGNRKNFVKPLLYNEITEYLKKRFNAVFTEGYEADDAMSIRAMELRQMGYDPIIATADKDLKQVPCKNYDLMSGKLIDISEDPLGEITLKFTGGSAQLKGHGMMFFYAQMLIGDAVDNIGGCAGVGAKRAFEALSVCETEEECQQTVEQIYVDKYGIEPKERICWDGSKYYGNAYTLLLENAKLLWMLREKPNSKGTHIFKPWWPRDKENFTVEEKAA